MTAYLFLFLAFAGLSAFYAAYLLGLRRAFGGYAPKTKAAPPYPTVSVVVAARNEAENISTCLESLLAQDYPVEKYEIILADDHSQDGTAELAEGAYYTYTKIASEENPEDCRAFPAFQVICLAEKKTPGGKKAALSAAVSAANGTVVCATDADCVVPKTWLRAMTGCFGDQTAFVSGPVRFRSNGGWFQDAQALESAGLVMLGGGGIAAKAPHLCNGGNLAYRRDAFYAVGGYADDLDTASGDDMFLLEKMKRAGYGVAFAKTPAAIIETAAEPTLRGFWRQRLRWAGKNSRFANARLKFSLGLIWALHLAGPLCLAALLVSPESRTWPNLALCFAAAALKFAADCFALKTATTFLNNARLMRRFWSVQPVYWLYILATGLVSQVVRRYDWKGRTARH